MEDPKPTNNKTCSCQWKSDCPLNQSCLSEYLVYNAVVNRSTTKNYYRTCKNNFKERYNNPTSSFKNKLWQKSTELSNYIWELKENGTKGHWYICGARKCDLCLCENLMVATANSAIQRERETERDRQRETDRETETDRQTDRAKCVKYVKYMISINMNLHIDHYYWPFSINNYCTNKNVKCNRLHELVFFNFNISNLW